LSDVVDDLSSKSLSGLMIDCDGLVGRPNELLSSSSESRVKGFSGFGGGFSDFGGGFFGSSSNQSSSLAAGFDDGGSILVTFLPIPNGSSSSSLSVKTVFVG
jgi:hypothetical protein